ncbi:LysR family transcriptional regulator [Paenibacillus validus]|nr:MULTISPECIES: LysR family transcriptional regulator [Paenibacillus]MED4602760.1 LysR family transcriptional regulator [Paenibacillus validus]MED4608087.1 LysR family transcriptional regulator [Paenibacillus validus]
MKTIERMESFLVLAECGSFTEAAKRLHCSQPTISHHILQLEEQFRAPLFQRKGRQVQLTEQGKIVLDYTRQVTRLLREAGEKVQQSLRRQESILSVYISQYIANYYLPDILSHYHKAFPEQLLEVYASCYTDLQRALLEGKTNVAFLPIYPEDEAVYSRFDAYELFEDELPLVIPAGHPWTERKLLYSRDLHQTTVLLPQSFYISEYIQTHLERFNVQVRFLQMSNFTVILQAIKAGLGIAFLPYPVIREEVRRGELAVSQVASIQIRRKNGFVIRKDARLTEAEESFCREMQQYFAPKQLRV